MSDFAGMEDLLQDFLQEAHDLLSDVDNKLVDLEKMPDDRGLLNDIFRGFHTIKGGAGFLNAAELVTLCHLTENLFDRLRNAELSLNPELMDVIMAATKGVRDMFGELGQMVQPQPAEAHVIAALKGALLGEAPAPVAAAPVEAAPVQAAPAAASGEPDWNVLHAAVTGQPAAPAQGEIITKAETAGAGAAQAAPPVAAAAPAAAQAPSPFGRRTSDRPATPPSASRRVEERGRENTIRVDTSRLDQVLNLSGEIGLTKNRLTSLRADILAGKNDSETLHALDQAVSQLDLLVSDLQNSVMKTRMQPIGRLFQKYPRIARDLARQLGKDVELVLSGEETEVDKTMIEDLADPLIHLIRNAVDHGVEMPNERQLSGKPVKSLVRLEARQEGDHIVLIIADDGKGMSAERIRAKAVEKGLFRKKRRTRWMSVRAQPDFPARVLDQGANSDVSGRGVGMDVVKTNIQKLNGSIEIRSEPGKGRFSSFPCR
jgi:two-component system, chemotaxis family, sensor kinase CheA